MQICVSGNLGNSVRWGDIVTSYLWFRFKTGHLAHLVQNTVHHKNYQDIVFGPYHHIALACV